MSESLSITNGRRSIYPLPTHVPILRILMPRVIPPPPIPDANPGAASLIVAQDHAKAARLWQEASERFGDRGARYNYAQCLLHGHGVPGALQSERAGVHGAFFWSSSCDDEHAPAIFPHRVLFLIS